MYCTEMGLQRAQEEISTLQSRLNQAKAAPTGRPHADPDRQDSQAQQDLLRERLRSLSQIVKNAQLIKPQARESKAVAIGSKILIGYADGTREQYRILGTLDVDIDLGIISNESPLALAVLGKEQGERLNFNGEPITLLNVQPWEG